MCNKAVDNYPHALEFVSECYKSQCVIKLLIFIFLQYNLFLNTIILKKCVHRCFFVFDSIPDQYKTQEIRDIIVSLHPFLIVHCVDQNKIQILCYEDVISVLLCTQIMVYFFLMKILLVSHFVLMKWVFLV